LLLLSICCLLTTKWAELYQYKYKTLTLETGQYTNIMICLNIFLYGIFILLIILHSSLQSTEQIDCTTTAAQIVILQRPAIVAYVYKAIYALLAILLALSFSVNAQRIIRISDRETDLMILSIICAVALIAQAIHLIVTSVLRSSDVISTVLTITIIELGATTALLNLYNRTSIFFLKKKITDSSIRISTVRKESMD